MVTDHDWIAKAMHLFAWAMPGELRVFEPDQFDEAKAWAAAAERVSSRVSSAPWRITEVTGSLRAITMIAASTRTRPPKNATWESGGEREVGLQQERADEDRDERLEHEHGRDDLGRAHPLQG